MMAKRPSAAAAPPTSHTDPSAGLVSDADAAVASRAATGCDGVDTAALHFSGDAGGVTLALTFLAAAELSHTADDGSPAPLPPLFPMLFHAVCDATRLGVWRQARMPDGPLGPRPPVGWNVLTPRWDAARKHEEIRVCGADDRIVVMPDQGGFRGAYAADALAPGKKHFFAVGVVEDDGYVGVATEGMDVSTQHLTPGFGDTGATASWFLHAYGHTVAVEVAADFNEEVDVGEDSPRARNGSVIGVLVDLTGDPSVAADDPTAGAMPVGGTVSFFRNGHPMVCDGVRRARLPRRDVQYYPAVILGCCDACFVSLGPDDDWRGITAAKAAEGEPEPFGTPAHESDTDNETRSDGGSSAATSSAAARIRATWRGSESEADGDDS